MKKGKRRGLVLRALALLFTLALLWECGALTPDARAAEVDPADGTACFVLWDKVKNSNELQEKLSRDKAQPILLSFSPWTIFGNPSDSKMYFACATEWDYDWDVKEEDYCLVDQPSIAERRFDDMRELWRSGESFMTQGTYNSLWARLVTEDNKPALILNLSDGQDGPGKFIGPGGEYSGYKDTSFAMKYMETKPFLISGTGNSPQKFRMWHDDKTHSDEDVWFKEGLIALRDDEKMYFSTMHAGTAITASAITHDFTVLNDQATTVGRPLSYIPKGVTLRVANGGVLTVSGMLFNDGKIVVEEGGLLVLRENALVAPWDDKSSGGGISSAGTIVVENGAKLLGGGSNGLYITGGIDYNFGFVMSENFTVKKANIIENQDSGSVVAGKTCNAAYKNGMLCDHARVALGKSSALSYRTPGPQGYEVMVLDLRDTYSSSRWNPLEPIWDAYQQSIHADDGMIGHIDSMDDYPDLRRLDGDAKEGAPWVEWNGVAYADLEHVKDDINLAKQKIFDEMYEDLLDLVGGLVPITNEKDQMWERGARSLVTAVCLAMLEDSENPELGMTKEKFNLFNINKAISNSDNNYQALKDYFEGRGALSQAYQLSRQVLSAPDETLASYMSVTLDKFTIFNDRGLCGLTSATDLRADKLAFGKTAVFLKIPDEKDTRHALASLFILSTYKALIKIATPLPGQTLPRNVYFIMDEFGNMPKIDKFGQMITVGRSRKIWFNMVVQSFVQLTNVYGKEVADIVIGNCGVKMFIGSNDTDTCKMFSEMCGNMTVKTTSTSSNLRSRADDVNVSTQTQVRPLIYPSELQRLNNQESTGNSIIVSFNSFPLKTKYTPSYKCPYYKFGPMDLTEIRSNIFKADKVFYDLKVRNRKILGKSA